MNCEHENCTIVAEEARGLSTFVIGVCDLCSAIVEAEK
jgi:hypothetical protein